MQPPAIRHESQTALAVRKPGLPASIYTHTGDSDRIVFGRFFSLLRRQTRIFLWTATLIFVLGALATLLMPRTYTSVAVVKLQGASQLVNKQVADKNQAVDTDKLTTDSDVSTEISVIQSDKLARQVYEDEHLMTDPEFNPDLKGLNGKDLDAAVAALKKLSPQDALLLEDNLVGLLESNLDVDRIVDSFTLAISFRSHYPEFSQRMANSFASHYVRAQVVEGQAAGGKAAAFLASKVEELRRAASSDFAAVQNYRIQNGLLSTTGSTLTEQDLSVYNQQTAAARSDAAAAQAALATARRQLASGSHGDDVGEALTSPVISGLRGQRAAMAAKVADLSANFGPRYPDLIAARNNLAAIDEQIQAEINRVISNLEAKANVASQRLASLDGTVNTAKGTLASNNKAMIALDGLQKRADASQDLYKDYVTRYRDVVAQSGLEKPNALIITSANLPVLPSTPKIPVYLVLSAFLGIFFGILAALVRELQFTGMTTGEDVEARVGIPFLGSIPTNGSVKAHAATALETLTRQPNSVMAESVRSILIATQMPMSDRARVLAVSSALSGEGKTTLVSMLGFTAARQGIRTVVVDCDIMIRGLSRHYGLESGAGIQDFLNGTAELDDIIWHIDGSNVSVVPITNTAAPGTRLTTEGAIHKIVAQLKERYQLIILDFPPLHAVAEAREMAGLADGVILATHWRKTSSSNLREAARMLPVHLADRVGGVLTMMNMKKQRKFAPESAASYGAAYQDYAARSA